MSKTKIFEFLGYTFLAIASLGYLASATGTHLFPFSVKFQGVGNGVALWFFIFACVFYLLSRRFIVPVQSGKVQQSVLGLALKWIIILIPLGVIAFLFYLVWLFEQSGGLNIN